MDNSSPKYKIALELINKILVNSNKEEVDDLTKFVDIDRELIISDKNKNDFATMEKSIFKYFDKAKTGWYRRKTTTCYILTFLRYMCIDLGLEFEYKQKEIYSNINGSNYRKSHTFYTIKLP